MAQIPRNLLDELTEEINGISEAGQQMILNVLENAEWETVAELRAISVEAMETVCGSVAEMAAARSAEFYDGVRTEAVGSALGATVDAGYDSDKTKGAVRAFMQSVVETGVTVQLASKLAERVDIETKRAANLCVQANCRRDPLKPRYARVPTGKDTCSFCFMLSAFGFHYTTSEAASHVHSGCDCRVVPGFDGMKVKGYDPDDMHKRLGVCEEAIGGNDGIREKWNALPKEKRNVYVAKHGEDAYQKFKNKCIVQELETRDPEWLRTGKAPAIDYSKSPRSNYGRMLKAGDYSPENIVDRGNEWRDLYAHDLLASNGFKIEARPAKAPDGFRNVDLLIGGKLWEVKSPGDPNDSSAGSNLRFVENNLRSAVKQFLNQYDESTKGRMEYKGPIRVVFSSYYRSANDDDIESELLRMMKMHNVDEVLHCRKDGKVTHLKKR